MVKNFILLFLFKGLEICGRSAEAGFGDVDYDGNQDQRAFDIVLMKINYDDEGNLIGYTDSEVDVVFNKVNIANHVKLTESKALELLPEFSKREDFLNLSDLQLPEPSAE